MAGSTFGNIFKISTWGESHGIAIGVVVDGCPAGLELSIDDIQSFLNRRRPGQSIYSSSRKEDDQVEILSGVFKGKTTGTPISMIVYNHAQKSSDYTELAAIYRPGHADYSFEQKYGFRDYRGGGRASARETIARVAAGAIASKILNQLGIFVTSYTKSIGKIEINYSNFNSKEILQNPLFMPDANAAIKAENYILKISEAHDSVGGIVETIIKGVPVGLGDPVFEKLDANLAKAIMSIGAVKSIEIGDGKDVSKHLGSQNNDAFMIDREQKISKKTNHAGGILGGISDGDNIIIDASFKPTPSISKTQNTINKNKDEIQISIKGRHDPIIVPRAVVVVESMCALTILDALLLNMTATIDGIKQFYK